MLRYSKRIEYSSEENTIRVTMYLHPTIYSDFLDIVGAVSYDRHSKKYHTDVNPQRIVNGPLSAYKEELEPPISDEYAHFIEDCLWLVNELGFTIIQQYSSMDSKKSEYVIIYGIDATPCGTIVYDLRISDHPFNSTFPEDLKDKALQYLQIAKVLDGTATKAGIDFQIEKVTVGSVNDDTWDRAFNRLYILLKRMRRKIKIRLQTR